ncbi:MAG: hypothetical protein SGPRY_001721 [Prymnesium sp.]
MGSPHAPHGASSAESELETDEELIRNIAAAARIDRCDAIVCLLAQSKVRASDLITESESRAEALLLQAGLSVGDCYKMMREIHRFHASPSPASRFSSCRGSWRIFLLRVALVLTPCCGLVRRKATVCAPPASVRPKATMKCGLVMYSATVMMITFTVLSFYLPAMLYHARSSNPRIGGHYLQPTQAHFGMPMLPVGSMGSQSSSVRQVMLVTANQPLPCTTRRGDWIMELALRNKLMYATLHGYKTWWSTELVSAWDLEAAWNKIPLLYVLMHPKSPVSQVIYIPRHVGNKGRIAEQGALTWVLFSQSLTWKDRVLLERNFTMNGNWMDYYGKWSKGKRTLSMPVWETREFHSLCSTLGASRLSTSDASPSRDVQINNGEKEIHYFSWDDNFRKGPLVYQQRFDGSGNLLGECTGDKVRGEVSATYLDYPKAAERAAQLLPAAKIVILLREPVSRLVEICGKLTWTRNDCYNGISSIRVINENVVAAKQRAAAVAVWNRCNVDKKSLGTECLRQDFTKKLTDKELSWAWAKGADGVMAGVRALVITRFQQVAQLVLAGAG